MTRLVASRQKWRRLLCLHWPCFASELRPAVPVQLAVDEFNGTACVGLVALVVKAARPVEVPLPMGLSFEESNVRTHVRSKNGPVPGVYFFSLDAASLPAFGLPYF